MRVSPLGLNKRKFVTEPVTRRSILESIRFAVEPIPSVFLTIPSSRIQLLIGIMWIVRRLAGYLENFGSRH